ncbi:hypothetical protein ACI65C_006124 [Semiaphis heraclei]
MVRNVSRGTATVHRPIANLVNIPQNTLVQELVAFSKIYPSMNGTLSQRAEEIYDNMQNNENNLVDDDSIDEEDDTTPNATMDNLANLEKELLEEVNVQEILQYVKQSSSLMCKLLS